jgi:ubiquinone/menaquinone biosynthesis C-methylase UbiE
VENLSATQTAPDEALKGEVREFWNKQSCDTDRTSLPKFSKEYFDDIEAFRYYDQPFIHQFAQFSRYHGKKVLEVGFGAATDFVQWARAGARLTGIDLTPEAFEHARHRLEVYGLPQPEGFRVGDAENLPFESNTFDLGYSFGVLHHTPDTIKAIGEVVRVVKPGGEIKIMIYNRRSIYAINTWVRHALMKGKPFKSVAWALWNHMESVGTKSYTRAEVASIFSKLPVTRVTCKTEITAADFLSASAFAPLNLFYRLLIHLAGESYPWRASEFHERTGPVEKRAEYARKNRPADEIVFTGNPLGFFHCISATKKV